LTLDARLGEPLVGFPNTDAIVVGEPPDRLLLLVDPAQLVHGRTLHGWLSPSGGTPTIEPVILHRPFHLAPRHALMLGDPIHGPQLLVELGQALS